MGFVPFPNTAQVSLIFAHNGIRCQNVFHTQRGTAYTASDLEDVAEMFATWWLNSIRMFCSGGTTLLKVEAVALDEENGAGIEYSTGLPATGTGTGSPSMPGNVTLAVKWVTGFRGRSYRGRTYHIGLRESMVQGNTLEAGVLAELLGGYSTLITVAQLAGHTLVVASRVADGVERTVGLTNEIRSCTINPELDSQRRRLG